ncbi:DivIVA domain-containing protein [Actinoplanes aureus]|uniref:DivIVA domain-containing protein n=1 Tax=Actinoplanes aureus TaxID=2792083 RepID=UPI002816687C|nr:DivIVA domain-containing protein [Actinoplanes aureus]
MTGKLTPADIHNAVFSRPPLGKRGYDEGEVDAFLDEAEQEITRLTAENRRLRESLQRTGASQRVLTTRLERRLAELAEAEQHAERVRAELERARAAARAVPPPPPPSGNADRVVAIAQRTADEHLREAQQEAESLLTTARTKADQLTSEAQLKASTIDSDARHRHTEAINGIAGKRAAALEEIDELGRRAESLRESVHDQVTQRLQDLK